MPLLVGGKSGAQFSYNVVEYSVTYEVLNEPCDQNKTLSIILSFLVTKYDSQLQMNDIY